MTPSNYPLSWPSAQRRTLSVLRRAAAFKVSLRKAREELVHELELLKAADELVLSTNLMVRQDGLFFADADYKEPTDPGVAVYFRRKGALYVLACDSYRLTRHNLRAIGLTIRAMRGIERHGGATNLMEQALAAFAALPSGHEPWWTVLGVSGDATREEARRAYVALAALHHPDRGGNEHMMARINRAMQEASGAIYTRGDRGEGEGASP